MERWNTRRVLDYLNLYIVWTSIEIGRRIITPSEPVSLVTESTFTSLSELEYLKNVHNLLFYLYFLSRLVHCILFLISFSPTTTMFIMMEVNSFRKVVRFSIRFTLEVPIT